MQIERLRRWPSDNDARWFDEDWSRKDKLRAGQISKVDLTIEARCSEVYGNTHVAGLCNAGNA